jgi:hypothetical protein
MWDRLKQADLEQARQQLNLRRDEVLRKHAEEMQLLAADQVAIETLDHLASAFFRKIGKLDTLSDMKAAPTASAALVTPIDPPAAIKPAVAVKPAITVKPAMTDKPAATVKPNQHRVPHRHSADKPAPKNRHPAQRDHRTNFETYLHAMVKNERGW